MSGTRVTRGPLPASSSPMAVKTKAGRRCVRAATRRPVLMFAVIFEVAPRAGQWDAYLETAEALRPELEQIDGFVDNIRYKSLTRDGWILSLSGWRDGKAAVRWRTQAHHHEAQGRGRSEI